MAVHQYSDDEHSTVDGRAYIYYADLFMDEAGDERVNEGTSQDYFHTYDIIVATDGKVF